METIIILGIILAVLLVMCGIIIGGFLFIPKIATTSSVAEWILIVIGVGGTVISMILFIHEIREYCNRDMEFSSNEYNVGKKIIIPENINENINTDKSDTVFFFNFIKK